MADLIPAALTSDSVGLLLSASSSKNAGQMSPIAGLCGAVLGSSIRRCPPQCNRHVGCAKYVNEPVYRVSSLWSDNPVGRRSSRSAPLRRLGVKHPKRVNSKCLGLEQRRRPGEPRSTISSTTRQRRDKRRRETRAARVSKRPWTRASAMAISSTFTILSSA
jgi:hypothetical protein